MAISTTSFEVPGATEIHFDDDTLHAELTDGRRIAVPLAWYPRLLHATPEERGNWAIIAGGQHLHCPDIDEDISVEMLLTGQKSGESQTSFKRWTEARKAGLPVNIHDITPAASQN